MKTTRFGFWLVAAGAAVSAGIGGASANPPLPKAARFIVAQAAETAGKAADKTTGHGDGVVRAVDADERRIMITHGPVSGPLEMSPMTMAFRVAPNVDLSSLSKGAKIKFTISRDAKGLYVIEDIQTEKP